ncbi:tetratricopeptide repeat protein [Verrucomicrobiota bacterium]
MPELPWSLEIAAPGFEVEETEIAPSGDAARLQAVNKATGVILSAFLEKAPKKGDSKACREHYWNRAKQSPFKKEHIRMRESGPLAAVEYSVPDLLGKGGSQRNLNAYVAEGEYWMDVHLSTTSERTGNQDPFSPILKAIRINHAYAPTASDRFNFGNVYYQQKNYKRAAAQYEKALDIEKQKTSLARNLWLVLVDQLGMSYGLSGELAKSQRLYEWAVTKEPDYPMFYYSLACAFAEMGNQDKAIENLRLAHRHRDESLPGESVPNPRTDSFFTKYLSNPEFRAALDKMK